LVPHALPDMLTNGNSLLQPNIKIKQKPNDNWTL
jgi:hypothetical protein